MSQQNKKHVKMKSKKKNKSKFKCSAFETNKAIYFV